MTDVVIATDGMSWVEGADRYARAWRPIGSRLFRRTEHFIPVQGGYELQVPPQTRLQDLVSGLGKLRQRKEGSKLTRGEQHAVRGFTLKRIRAGLRRFEAHLRKLREINDSMPSASGFAPTRFKRITASQLDCYAQLIEVVKQEIGPLGEHPTREKFLGATRLHKAAIELARWVLKNKHAASLATTEACPIERVHSFLETVETISHQLRHPRQRFTVASGAVVASFVGIAWLLPRLIPISRSEVQNPAVG